MEVKSTDRRPLSADIEVEILLRLPVKTLVRLKCACKSWYSLISSPQFQKDHFRRAQPNPPLLLALDSEIAIGSSPMEVKSTDWRPLPADIEVEILLLLPVKSLVRFKCACKSWYSLISSPQFQKDRFRPAQQKPPLLLTLHRNENSISFITYNKSKEGALTLFDNFSKTLPPPYSGVGVKPYMQSCRGLVCLSSRSRSGPPLILFSPSTQELISLPPTTAWKACVGFGYALPTHEFKVVRFIYGVKETRCEVFTLGTSHWRKVGSLPFLVCKGTAPFLHGAVHCLSLTKFSGVHHTDAIAVFDIETEEYKEMIPLPAFYHSLGDCQHRGIASTGDFMCLMKLGGSLGLIFDFGDLTRILDVWLLKDYSNGEWVKGYTINVSSVYPNASFFWASPTDNMGDEEDDDILLNCTDGHGDTLEVKLLGYNPKDGNVTVMKDNVWASTFYVETFYPL